MAISTTNSFGSSLLIATFKIFEISSRHKRLYLLVEGIITSPLLKQVIQKISAKLEKELFGLTEESAKFLFGEENYSHKRAILSEFLYIFLEKYRQTLKRSDHVQNIS